MGAAAECSAVGNCGNSTAADRVRVRSRRTIGPLLADEVESADHFVGGKSGRGGDLFVRGSVCRGAKRGGVGGRSAWASQVLMRVVDARIKHRHANSGPGQAEVLHRGRA